MGITDFYDVIGLHLLLFRSSLSEEPQVLEVRQMEPVQPKIIKDFSEGFVAGLDAAGEGVASYISQASARMLKPLKPQNMSQIIEQIDRVIEIENAYQEALRAKELEEQRAAEALERQRLEEERIEAERQAELERIAAEKAEQERLVQEMLEQKRREQEEAERERERLEQERLALLEEKRKQEEAERARLEEERRQRELEEAAKRERIRIAEEKKLVREELGTAAGIKAKAETPKEDTKESLEPEDPAAIAARMKREQQQREKERIETERAQRLKAERKYFESKPFEEIRREYTWNPIWVLYRLIRHILAMVFGIIPENTDNPDYKERRRQIEQRREEKKREKEERTRMEVYYKKYAQTFRYRTLRSIQDYKFQRKRMKERKNKPRPEYKSKLTPEQRIEIQKQMNAFRRDVSSLSS